MSNPYKKPNYNDPYYDPYSPYGYDRKYEYDGKYPYGELYNDYRISIQGSLTNSLVNLTLSIRAILNNQNSSHAHLCAVLNEFKLHKMKPKQFKELFIGVVKHGNTSFDIIKSIMNYIHWGPTISQEEFELIQAIKNKLTNVSFIQHDEAKNIVNELNSNIKYFSEINKANKHLQLLNNELNTEMLKSTTQVNESNLDAVTGKDLRFVYYNHSIQKTSISRLNRTAIWFNNLINHDNFESSNLIHDIVSDIIDTPLTPESRILFTQVFEVLESNEKSLAYLHKLGEHELFSLFLAANKSRTYKLRPLAKPKEEVKTEQQLDQPKTQQPHQQGEKKMEKEEVTFMDQIKEKGTLAARRSTSRTVTKNVKKAILKILEKNGQSSESIAMASAMLDTEGGTAVVSMLLGLILQNVPIPGFQGNDQVKKMADEFQVEGMSVGMEMVMSVLTDDLVPAIVGALATLPQIEEEPKARVAHVEQPKVKVAPHHEDEGEEEAHQSKRKAQSVSK